MSLWRPATAGRGKTAENRFRDLARRHSMSEQNSFTDLIRRIRAGDNQAAADLVRQYGATVRRHARLRLHDARLRRLLDSMDVCQSALGSFFARAAAGQYDL